MTAHQHQALLTTIKPYSGPIPGAAENPAAHGAIRYEQTCSCGARRCSNVNRGHSELGPWVEHEPDGCDRGLAFIAPPGE